MSRFIKPPGGVDAFLARFGKIGTVQNFGRSLGFTITQREITKWRETDQIPDLMYHALSSLIVEDETILASGFIEFYCEGKAIGQFHLHPKITAIIRKKRRTEK